MKDMGHKHITKILPLSLPVFTLLIFMGTLELKNFFYSTRITHVRISHTEYEDTKD